MQGAFELTGITTVALAAMMCGMLMTRLRQPAIVGYILAGVILGPAGFKLVGDREQVHILAELGVLMLLYFIGMELSLRSFRRLWRLAVITTLLQIGASVGATVLFMQLLSWPIEQAVLFGFVLALSSTAVAVRMLQDIGELRTRAGRITVGVLIAQDLAVAPMLLIIGGMAGGTVGYWIIAKVGAAILLLAAAIYFLSGRRKIDLPFADLLATKPDLAPLMALCWCLGFAVVAGLIGLSPPFGAFLAGLIVGNSAQRHAAYQMAKPIESILMMVFFLSIGLLIDLSFIWNNLALVLMLWLFIAVFKSALNMTVLHLLGERWQVAFLSSVVLAQIGEFSFVLGSAGIDHAIINTDLHRLIVAVTVLSLVTSPLYMASARRIRHRAADQIDTLSRLLQLVYFREWRATRKVTARAVDATRDVATRAKALREKRKSTDSRADSESGAEEAPTATPPANENVEPQAEDDEDASALVEDVEADADLEPAETSLSEATEDDAGLPTRTRVRRPGGRHRRSGPRAVGGTGRGRGSGSRSDEPS
jgi:CPA2 family monovalent cation:H+ antiporter-2